MRLQPLILQQYGLETYVHLVIAPYTANTALQQPEKSACLHMPEGSGDWGEILGQPEINVARMVWHSRSQPASFKNSETALPTRQATCMGTIISPSKQVGSAAFDKSNFVFDSNKQGPHSHHTSPDALAIQKASISFTSVDKPPGRMLSQKCFTGF